MLRYSGSSNNVTHLGSRPSYSACSARPPLGRPLVFTPEDVLAEPVSFDEIEGLLEIEAEPSGVGAGVGDSVGAEGRGWEIVSEEGPLRIEQWTPHSEDEQSSLLIMRCTSTLHGVPPAIATENLYDFRARRRWDERVAKMRHVKHQGSRVGHGGTYNDVVYTETHAVFGVLPSCHFIHWRGLTRMEDCTVWLSRDVGPDLVEDQAQEQPPDPGAESSWSSWMPTFESVRLRNMVSGTVVRSIGPASEQRGSVVCAYLQIKVSGAFEMLAPRLARDFTAGAWDSYQKACLAVVSVIASPRRPPEYFDMATQDGRSEVASPGECRADSLADFLGVASGGKLLRRASDAKTSESQLPRRRRRASAHGYRATSVIDSSCGGAVIAVASAAAAAALVPVIETRTLKRHTVASTFSSPTAASASSMSPTHRALGAIESPAVSSSALPTTSASSEADDMSVCQTSSLSVQDRRRSLRAQSRERQQRSMANVAMRLSVVMQERGGELDVVPEEPEHASEGKVPDAKAVNESRPDPIGEIRPKRFTLPQPARRNSLSSASSASRSTLSFTPAQRVGPAERSAADDATSVSSPSSSCMTSPSLAKADVTNAAGPQRAKPSSSLDSTAPTAVVLGAAEKLSKLCAESGVESQVSEVSVLTPPGSARRSQAEPAPEPPYSSGPSTPLNASSSGCPGAGPSSSASGSDVVRRGTAPAAAVTQAFLFCSPKEQRRPLTRSTIAGHAQGVAGDCKRVSAAAPSSQQPQRRRSSHKASEVTRTFQPGKIGLRLDWSNGLVNRVSVGGQAELKGVRPGMVIVLLDGRPYVAERLERRIVGHREFEITFKAM